MLIKIIWPKDSRRRVKLKRYLFGYVSKRGKLKLKVNGKFKVRRVRRGTIQVSPADWFKLKNFLDELGVEYKVMKSKYLISGPLALIKHGVNAFDKSYFKLLVDEEGLVRAEGKYASLEDAIISTFERAIKDRKEWLNYVVMAFLIREIDWHYILKRAKEFNVLEDFNVFINLIFKTLMGELDPITVTELYNLTIKYKDIVSYFRSIHWKIPPMAKAIEHFNDLNPKTIVSLAEKQLFYT